MVEMLKDKRNIAIIILVIALAVVSYIAFAPKPVPYDKKLFEDEIRKLNNEKKQLDSAYAVEKGKTKSFVSQIDSLEKLKQKPIYVYIEKTKQIDNASANGVVSELNNVFAGSNIK